MPNNTTQALTPSKKITSDCQQCPFGQFIYHTPNFYQTWAYLQNTIQILNTLKNQQNQYQNIPILEKIEEKELTDIIYNLKKLDNAINNIVNRLIHSS